MKLSKKILKIAQCLSEAVVKLRSHLKAFTDLEGLQLFLQPLCGTRLSVPQHGRNEALKRARLSFLCGNKAIFSFGGKYRLYYWLMQRKALLHRPHVALIDHMWP